MMPLDPSSPDDPFDPMPDMDHERVAEIQCWKCDRRFLRCPDANPVQQLLEHRRRTGHQGSSWLFSGTR